MPSIEFVGIVRQISAGRHVMRFKRARLLLMAMFLAIASTALASTTWYVNGVSGSDNNNCMSSQIACKTIGHAISLLRAIPSWSLPHASIEHPPVFGGKVKTFDDQETLKVAGVHPDRQHRSV
jgi:hypothetical protein